MSIKTNQNKNSFKISISSKKNQNSIIVFDKQLYSQKMHTTQQIKTNHMIMKKIYFEFDETSIMNNINKFENNNDDQRISTTTSKLIKYDVQRQLMSN